MTPQEKKELSTLYKMFISKDIFMSKSEYYRMLELETIAKESELKSITV